MNVDEYIASYKSLDSRFKELLEDERFQSSNLSLQMTSSLPFFDDNVTRNRSYYTASFIAVSKSQVQIQPFAYLVVIRINVQASGSNDNPNRYLGSPRSSSGSR